MKTFTLADIFTDEQLDQLLVAWKKYERGEAPFHGAAVALITPWLPEIAVKTKQENDADYLAYMVEYAISKVGHKDS